MTEYKCVNGHDRCYDGTSAGPECPYCEKKPRNKSPKTLIKERFRSLGVSTQESIRGAEEVIHVLEQNGYEIKKMGAMPSVEEMRARGLIGDKPLNVVTPTGKCYANGYSGYED